MAKYKEHGETIILINGDMSAVVVHEDLVSNPELTMPLGKYESFRVRTALVRSADYNEKKAPVISCSEDAYQVVRDSMVEPQECMYALLLDARNHLIGVHEISRGGTTSSIVEPSNIFQAAIVANATGIILAHNHPSGNPLHSVQDVELFQAVHAAGSVLGIRVLDFLVVGYESYESFADIGLM